MKLTNADRGQLLELPESLGLAMTDLKAALAHLYGERLRGVYLYGSYARGDYHPDSDVDILVVLAGPMHPGIEITRMSAIVSELCFHHDLLIAILPIDSKEWDSDFDPLFATARQEAVAL